MSTSADSAEQVVRITLNGAEVAIRILGKSAEAVARITAFLVALAKDSDSNSPGRKTLAQMLRDGKAVEFFELPARDLKAFTAQAKQYGIRFHEINLTPDDPNAVVDLMVRQEDAPRINRIIERFQLAAVQAGQAEKSQEPELVEGPEEPELGVQEKSEHERLLEEIVAPKENSNRNPTAAKTEAAHPSAPSSEKLPLAEKDKKPSVREHLQEIKEELAAAKPEAPQIELKTPELGR